MFRSAIRFIFCTLLFGTSCFVLTAGEKQEYPKDYFRNPLDIPISLAGNFGECRPGHFHSGIDIKTNGRENLPVYAAAEGYISRIRMQRGGFGHALYLTHPAGYTTVYAHLNDFIPTVQAYLRAQQYTQESWEVDLELTADQFPVSKGMQIAWSGNTGSSMGPHLHFEIRDTETEHPLNPLLFGLPVRDAVAPVPLRLAVYEMPFSGIYNRKPSLYPLQRKGNEYVPEGGVIPVKKGVPAGIGIEVNDFMDGSSNTLGFYTAELYLDNVLQAGLLLDDIGYHETRYLHAYADYRSRFRDRRWLQCFFRLPGNRLQKVYTYLNEQDGLLQLAGDSPAELRAEIRDAAGNATTVRWQFRPESAAPLPPEPCTRPVSAGMQYELDTAGISFMLPGDALYTDICLRIRKEHTAGGYSAKFTVQDPATPVHSYFDLKIMPDRPVPFHLKNKMVLIYDDGQKQTGKAAVPAPFGWYQASVRAFGTYRLDLDTIPPVIVPMDGKAASGELQFRVRDARTSVKEFRAEIGTQWLLFEQRGDVFFYKFDDYCQPGNHVLKIRASDENGNTAMLEYPFRR